MNDEPDQQLPSDFDAWRRAKRTTRHERYRCRLEQSSEPDDPNWLAAVERDDDPDERSLPEREGWRDDLIANNLSNPKVPRLANVFRLPWRCSMAPVG